VVAGDGFFEYVEWDVWQVALVALAGATEEVEVLLAVAASGALQD
jgi:hypothetical protein